MRELYNLPMFSGAVDTKRLVINPPVFSHPVTVLQIVPKTRDVSLC